MPQTTRSSASWDVRFSRASTSSWSERRVSTTSMYRIAVIPGDGIGPEVTAAAREVVDATGLEIEWLECRAGADEAERTGETLPTAVLDVVRGADAALK